MDEPGDLHGVAAAPENEREHQVDEDDHHDRQADGATDSHAHRYRAAVPREAALRNMLASTRDPGKPVAVVS